MAGFVYFGDSNPLNEKRSHNRVIEQLAPVNFSGIQGNWQGASGALLWHQGEHAPFDLYQPIAGGCAALWGDAIAYENDTNLTAEDIFRLITSEGEAGAKKLNRYSGFYAWIVIDANESVTVGSDPLGIFPLYYFHEKSSFAVSTSLSALRTHPNYRSEIAPQAFTRYLIQNGSVGGQSIEQSGLHLPISTTLRFNKNENQLQLWQHPHPTAANDISINSLEEAVEYFTHYLDNAVKRHTQKPVDFCLLSGGIDSRQLLAHTHQQGLKLNCFTLGRPLEYESEFARRVAKQLRLKWSCDDESHTDPLALITTENRLFSMGGGYSSMMMCGAFPQLRHQGRRFLTGLFLDSSTDPYRNITRKQVDDYDFCFRYWINRVGIPPERLRPLLKNGALREALDQSLLEIKNDWSSQYDGTSASYIQLIKKFRGRPHIGGFMWKASFYSWPAAPALDLPLYELLSAIPYEYSSNRKLQLEAMRRISPRLACIPHDAQMDKPTALNETWWNHVQMKWYKKRRRRQNLSRADLHRTARINDLDGEWWKNIRILADEKRECSADHFDMDALKKILPRANETIMGQKNNRFDFIWMRMLIGAITWIGTRDEDTRE